MRLYSMDSLIIEIYNIRNIESIKIYDIVSTGSLELNLIPSLLVTYDGGKMINLCRRDKYFDIFVKKVIEVYNDEKNKILEDSLSDPFKLNKNIQIDERTKSILENGMLTEMNELYKFYSEKKYYGRSLLFEKDEAELLISMVKYHIKQLFSTTDKSIDFSDEFNGYKNTYMLSGTINGIFKYFPIKFDKKSENEYDIEIGGLFENSNSAIITIKFTKDSIQVTINIDNYNIAGNYVYLISKDIIKEIQSIKRDNIPIYYRNNDLFEIDNPYKLITDFDQNTNLKWFSLPWGAIYGINSNIQELSQNEKIIEIHNMYVDNSTEHSFMRKEYFSKNYIKNGYGSSFSRTVTLDEVVKNTTGVCLNKENGVYLIESLFFDNMYSSDYYDEKIREKYFYHLIKTNSIKDIKKEQLISVNDEVGILDNNDMLNDNLILKLVKEK